MKMWADLRVKTKLLVLVGICCSALILVGFLGLSSLKNMSSGFNETNSGMKQVSILQEMKNDFLVIRLDLVYMLALTDAAKIAEKSGDMTKRAGKIMDSLVSLEKQGQQESDKELLKVFRNGLEAYLAQGNKLAEMAREAAVSGNTAAHRRGGSAADADIRTEAALRQRLDQP